MKNNEIRDYEMVMVPIQFSGKNEYTTFWVERLERENYSAASNFCFRIKARTNEYKKYINIDGSYREVSYHNYS